MNRRTYWILGILTILITGFISCDNMSKNVVGTVLDTGAQKAAVDIPSEPEIPSIIYGVALVGVGDLTTETSSGVRYTLRVTNIGNIKDTISMTVAGNVYATIIPSSVTLNQGGSRTVTLRIAGDAFDESGDYVVRVNAISQGDNTKTAEIVTITTVLLE